MLNIDRLNGLMVFKSFILNSESLGQSELKHLTGSTLSHFENKYEKTWQFVQYIGHKCRAFLSYSQFTFSWDKVVQQ